MQRRLIVTAAAAVLVFALGACGDDDDEGAGFGFPGQTTQPGAVPGGAAPAGGEGAAYTQASHDNFVNECTGFAGATPDLCECAWGSIVQTVPYADYQTFEAGFASGQTALPDWLTTAVATCS
jgi:hypothetical protein